MSCILEGTRQAGKRKETNCHKYKLDVQENMLETDHVVVNEKLKDRLVPLLCLS